MKDEIIESIIEGEKSIERSDKKLNTLYSKIGIIKSAIETLENDNFSIPECIYGVLDFYQSEYDNEYKLNQKIFRIIENIKKENNYRLTDKAKYISTHGGKYTWVSNGHLVDDDGLVFD